MNQTKQERIVIQVVEALEFLYKETYGAPVFKQRADFINNDVEEKLYPLIPFRQTFCEELQWIKEDWRGIKNSYGSLTMEFTFKGLFMCFHLRRRSKESQVKIIQRKLEKCYEKYN